MARKDQYSVQGSAGMLRGQDAIMQTVSQFGLVPEVVYNALEIKI